MLAGSLSTKQRFKPPWYGHMVCYGKTKETSMKPSSRPLHEDAFKAFMWDALFRLVVNARDE